MLKICPITLRTAQNFVREHHRHNDPPVGHKFSIGLMKDEQLIGVVIAGQPIARAHCDGFTAEITRCCVIDGNRNANSLLYGAAVRAAQAMGYRRIITYTLPDESGASLKAAGFRFDGFTVYKPWPVRTKARKLPKRCPKGPKLRWIKDCVVRNYR